MSEGPIRQPAPVEPTPLRPPRSRATRRRQFFLVLAVLGTGALLVGLVFLTKGEPPTAAPAPIVPAVGVAVAAPAPHAFEVVTHGTVAPRTETELVAEVPGRVVSVAPSLEAGGFFSAGDVLLELDGREHEIAVERARAAVKLAASEARLAEAEVGRRRELSKRGIASSADLEQFESRAAVARATLDQVRASLAQAELDLERTVVRAPFDGRVRERRVDLGQFVSPGVSLAKIFAVDYAEVRLPIRTEDLSYVDVPLGLGEADLSALDVPVTLSAKLGGQRREWPARLVRSEGDIDLTTRMLHVVARVEDPYARLGGERTPLPVGLFVQATIEGRELEDAYVLPAMALRERDRVFVVDPEERLRFREVDVVRRDGTDVVVGAGLAPGDRVIVSPLQNATEGMRVRAQPAEAP